jgi:hypothetical protein
MRVPRACSDGPSYTCCGPVTGLRAAGAIVTATSDLAPESSNARAHASSVAPVVTTSSTSKTRSLSTWLPGRVANAPRAISDGSAIGSTRFCGRSRVRTSKLLSQHSLRAAAIATASNAAGFKPRSWRRFPWGGTGSPISAANQLRQAPAEPFPRRSTPATLRMGWAQISQALFAQP